MKKRNILKQIEIAFDNQIFSKIEGFDDAVIGIDLNSMRLIYSVEKIIELLSHEMNEKDAVEYFEYKIVSENIGEYAPILCEDFF